MSTAIPTSTSITESAVIPAHLSQVWHFIKLQDFHVFWSKLKGSDFVKGASPETDVVKWEFKDGTVLEVKQEEHSVRLLRLANAFPPSPLLLLLDWLERLMKVACQDNNLADHWPRNDSQSITT